MKVYTSKGIIDSDKLPSGTPEYINSGITEKEYQTISKDLPDFNLGDMDNLNKNLYETQSPLEALGKGFWNAGVNIIGMGANWIGTYDDDLAKAVLNEERDYETWTSEWAREFVENNSKPIYESNPGSVNPTDPGWVGNQIAQAGQVIGIMVPSFAESLLVGAAATLVPGPVDDVVAGTKIGGNISKALNLLKNSTKAKVAFAASQGFNGSREALLESNEVYTTKKQQFLDAGYSEEEAHKAASEGARQNFTQNALTSVALNTAEAMLLSYNPVRGLTDAGKVESFLEKTLPNKYAFNSAKFITNNFMEGVEEFYQYGFQEEGGYLADTLIGLRKDDQSGIDRFKKYLSAGEAWNAAISGFVGAGVVGPMVSFAINKIINRGKAKVDQITKEDFGIRNEIINEMSNAVEQGDHRKYNALRNSLNRYRSLSALHIDEIKGKGDIHYSDYVNGLEEVLKAAENNETELLSKLNISGDNIDAIKSIYPSLIKDAKRTKELWKEELEKASDPVTLTGIVSRRMDLEITTEQLGEIEEEINRIKAIELSPNGVEYSSVKNQLEASKIHLEQVKKVLSTVTGKDRQHFLNELKAFNGTIIPSLEKQLKELKDKNIVPSKEDEALLASIGDESKVRNIYLTREALISKKKKLIKDLGEWRNPDNQIKKKLESVEKSINNAPTTEAKQDIVETEKEKSPHLEDDIDLIYEKALVKDKENIIEDKVKESSIPSDDLFKILQNTINRMYEDSNALGEPVSNDPVLSASIVEELVQKTGKKWEFAELMNDVKNLLGEKTFNEYYDTFVAGWKQLSEQKPEEYNAVKNYDSVKSSIDNGILDVIFKARGITPTVEKIEKQETPEVISPKERLNTIDATFSYSNNSNAEEIRTVEKDGTIKREFKEEEERSFILDAKSDEHKIVESRYLAIPNYLNEGDELTAKVYENYDTMYYNPTDEFGWRLNIIKYKVTGSNQWIEDKPRFADVKQGIIAVIKDRDNLSIKKEEKEIVIPPFTEGSEEYYNIVPIILTNPKDGKNVAWLHTDDYSNIYTLADEDKVAKQKEITSTLRRKVIKEGTLTLKIKGKTSGSLNQAKVQDIFPIKENGDSNPIILNTGKTTLSTNKKLDISNIIIEGEMRTAKGKSTNVPWELVPVGKSPNGKKIYFPKYNYSTELREEEVNSIINAFYIYSIRNLGIVDSLLEQLKRDYKINLASVNGLSEYISHFAFVKSIFLNEDGSIRLRDIDKFLDENIDPKMKEYIAKLKNSYIIGENTFKLEKGDDAKNKSAKTMIDLLFGPDSNSVVLNMLKDKKNSFRNFSHRHIESNKALPIITRIGDTNEFTVNAPYSTYDDYMRSNLLTDLREHTIDTPEYGLTKSLFIQPTYYIEESEIPVEQPQPFEVAKEVVIEPVKEEEVITEEKTNEFKIKKPQLENKDLFIKLINDLSNVLSPEERIIKSIDDMYSDTSEMLDDSNWKNIAKSLNVVPFLKPYQYQYIIDSLVYEAANVITDFDYINIDTVHNAIKGKLETLCDSKIKSLLLNLEKLNQLEPNSRISELIEDYEFAIKKLDSIKNSASLIQTEVIKKLKNASFLGTLDTIENEDGEMEQVFDVTPEELNPRDKISATIKRFFFSVYDLDKLGNVQKGFLGLPKFKNSDYVFETLMKNCADKGHTYEKIIEALIEQSDGNPWLYLNPNKEGLTEEERNTILENQKYTLLSRIQNDKSEVIEDTIEGKSLTQLQHRFVTAIAKTSFKSRFAMINKIKIKPREIGDPTMVKTILRIYDTTAGSLVKNIIDDWQANTKDPDSGILSYDTISGEYYYNKEKIKQLYSEFEHWTASYPINKELSRRLSIKAWKDKIVHDKVIPNSLGLTEPTMVNLNNDNYLLIPDGENIKIEKRYKSVNYGSLDNLQEWLDNIGITVSKETLEFLNVKGISSKHEKQVKNIRLKDMFSDNHLFDHIGSIFKSIIAKEGTVYESDEDIKKLFSNVVYDLAKIESRYVQRKIVSSIRDGKKTIYGFTASSYDNDVIKDFKSSKEFRDKYRQVPFTSDSIWLDLADTNKRFLLDLDIYSMAKTSIKLRGSNDYNDNSISKLSDGDHEASRIVFFEDQTQIGFSGALKLNDEYRFPLRWGGMFGLTMSDKTQLRSFKAPIINFNLDHFEFKDDKIILKDEVRELIFKYIVQSEIKRIDQFSRFDNVNIKGVDGSLFYLIPDLNSLKFDFNGNQISVLDYAMKKDTDINEKILTLKPIIKEFLNDFINDVADNKVESWQNSGIIGSNKNPYAMIIHDSNYMGKWSAVLSSKDRAKLAALDMEINYMLHNAELYKIIANDPAVYFKQDRNKGVKRSEFKPADYFSIVEDSLVNMGKRLALLSAPRSKGSNAEVMSHLQIFLADYEKEALNIDRIRETYGDEIADLYKKVTTTDAQEYTTWQEHITMLEHLGRISDELIAFELTPDDFKRAKELFSQNIDNEKLTDIDKQIVKKVLNPFKPVYTGRVYDETYNIFRTMYIKSAAVPLLPQMTKGTELDKLRIMMEELSNRNNGIGVRASYESANKVGAAKNPLNLFRGEKGKLTYEKAPEVFIPLDELTDEDYSNIKANYTLELPKYNHGSQQDLPYKAGKADEDLISHMTQMTKELFGDGVINIEDIIKGKSAVQYYDDYVNTFNRILSLKDTQLKRDVSTTKDLQKLLEKEAEEFSLRDKEGLKLDSTGEFILALPFLPNKDKIENFLQSIINKRLVKIKFPGYSYVAVSEAGFRFDSNSKETSDIVYIDGPVEESLEHNDILIPSYFRIDGKIIDLINDRNYEGKPYSEIVTENGKTFRKLNKELFDDSLLNLINARIPTSGHSSMSSDRIVGFLPTEQADIQVVAGSKAIPKGMDYDFDKENSYHYFHTVKGGKIIPYHKAYDLAKIEEELEAAEEHQIEKLEDIKEKILYNQLIDIINDVLNHKDVKKRSLLSLDTDDAAIHADKIHDIANKSLKGFTPLSSEYQKKKMLLGAAGKIGTGTYSLDVVFHNTCEILYAKDPENSPRINAEISLAGKTSDGILGKRFTLDKKRSISKVINERQQMALDNEKLQMLGKVNLNEITYDVDKVLNLLGLDKSTDEIHIPFYFLSQPVIKDYCFLINKMSSNISGFISDKEGRILKELKSKYPISEDNERSINELKINDLILSDESISSQDLVRGIEGDVDNYKQQLILEKFLAMAKIGKQIRRVQIIMNRDAKGVGKSFFESLSNLNSMYTLDVAFNDLSFMSTLVGESIEVPSTIQGVFASYSLLASKELWVDRNYPYDSTNIKNIFKKIETMRGNRPLSIKDKEDIFKEILKYINSHNYTNLYDKPISEERRRLLSEDNKESLGLYLSRLKKDRNTTDAISTNILIKALSYRQENGFGYIVYDNAAAEEFQEQDYYEALINLGTSNVPLPNFNDEEYSTRKLAEDLIKYSYLEGGIQGPYQFVKFVPVSFLLETGYAGFVNKVNKRLLEGQEVIDVDKFVLQYFANNPGKAHLVESVSKYAGITVEDDAESFPANASKESYLYPFIAKYNEGRQHTLYKLGTDGATYYRVSTLGSRYSSEYDPNATSMFRSIFAKGTQGTLIQSLPKENLISNTFSLRENDTTKILESIKNNTDISRELSKLAEYYLTLPIIKEKVKEISISNIPQLGTYANGIVTINNKLANGILYDKLAEVILHEFTHVIIDDILTKDSIDLSGNTKGIEANNPGYINDLVDLFFEARKVIKQDLGSTEYEDLLRKVKTKKTIDNSNEALVYGTSNLKEFVTIMMTKPEFRKVLNKPHNLKLREKIANFIRAIFKKIGINLSPNTISDDTLARVFMMMENTKTKVEEIKEKTIIPQNLISGIQAYGMTQHALPSIKEVLGDKTTSIDMIKAGFRTRTTRSKSEMDKYNVSVGDIVTHRGKSIDGSIISVDAKITAIYGNKDPRFKANWYKEGWTDEGIKSIERFKDGAAAIEFELLDKVEEPIKQKFENIQESKSELPNKTIINYTHSPEWDNDKDKGKKGYVKLPMVTSSETYSYVYGKEIKHDKLPSLTLYIVRDKVGKNFRVLEKETGRFLVNNITAQKYALSDIDLLIEKHGVDYILYMINQTRKLEIEDDTSAILGPSDIKYQLPQNRGNEENIASEKTIRDLAARMSDRIGIPVRFESDRTKEYKGKLENNIAIINLAYATLDTPIHEILGHPIIRTIKGDNKLRIGDNIEYDTLFHKNIKSKIKDIRGDNYILEDGNVIFGGELNKIKSDLYNNLLKELEYGKGKEVLDRIKRDYVYKERTFKHHYIGDGFTTETTKSAVVNITREEFEKAGKGELENRESNDYLDITTDTININGVIYTHTYGEDTQEKFTKRELPKYSLEEQQEEAIVELLGLMTAEKLDAVKDGKLISLLKRLLKEMKAFMRSLINQKEVEIDKLPDNMTLGDLSDLLAYSNSKLILPGYEVEYTTPDNEKFKTYQEASNHISELARDAQDIDLSNVELDTRINTAQIEELNDEIQALYSEKDAFKKANKLPFEEIIELNLPYGEADVYGFNEFDRVRMQNTKYRKGQHVEELGEDYVGYYIFGYNTDRDRPLKKILKITEEEAKKIYDMSNDIKSIFSKDVINHLNSIDQSILKKKHEIETLKNNSISQFIKQNKEYEQSKEIIEEWKRVNNIQYNPEEIYSRGQEFVSVLGAYSNFDVNLMMQNLLQHIEDNEKAGGKFTISAFTKPIDKNLYHIEGGGGKIKFKIYPQSEDILWAANTDVYSGSVWDASEKINKDKKSELLGVSYTKYPSLRNVYSVQPNLASIVDNLAHHHNELGIVITGNNFRLEYDENIPYATKKIINSVNSILDKKFGKLVKPNIDKVRKQDKIRDWRISEAGLNDGVPMWTLEYTSGNHVEDMDAEMVDFTSEQEARDYLHKLIEDSKKQIGIQPTQTNETLKESITSVNSRVGGISSDYDEKEYTSQALINSKIAKLKEVAKEYPRSLIRSEVKAIGNSNINFFDNIETPFQKLSKLIEGREFKDSTGKPIC